MHDRALATAACTDNSPAGRARRMSVAHRAGPFAQNGFPKAFGAAGPPWWQPVRRHPRVAAAMADKVSVSPSAGSLPAGGFVTVTVTSKSAVNTDLTVEPGNLAVRVMFKITKD